MLANYCHDDKWWSKNDWFIVEYMTVLYKNDGDDRSEYTLKTYIDCCEDCGANCYM